MAVTNGHKRSQTVTNGHKWSQMVTNCHKWSHMVSHGRKSSNRARMICITNGKGYKRTLERDLGKNEHAVERAEPFPNFWSPPVSSIGTCFDCVGDLVWTSVGQRLDNCRTLR